MIDLPWPLLAALVVALIYKQALSFTRDVPPEYLNDQSIVETTRLENESAIHKSTKLDYSLGLRVGLAIRYDHYKLRNGNLYDVWEIAMAHARKSGKAIGVNGQKVTLGQLNAAATALSTVLADMDEVFVPSSLFIENTAVLAVVVACFLTQTTVHVYEGDAHAASVTIANGDVFLAGVNCSELLSSESWEFDNQYTFEKDRGIALRLTHRANHRVVVTTSFTQGNLISAVASCIKHLPAKHAMGPDDRVAVVLGESAESVTNSLVKMLAALVAGAEVHVFQPHIAFMDCSPTIVSAPVEVVKSLDSAPAGIDKVLYWHRRFSLTCLRFSNFSTSKPYPSLRLLYAYRAIPGAYTDWNSLRASLVAHVVEEIGYFNVAGPLMATDIYDFRSFPAAVGQQIRAFGGIVQANEMKLVKLQEGTGELVVRGYNIGKAKTTMEGVGETAVIPDADGFYKLPYSARWGSDNCLYILK